MSEKQDSRQEDEGLVLILSGTTTDKPKGTKGDESRSAGSSPSGESSVPSVRGAEQAGATRPTPHRVAQAPSQTSAAQQPWHEQYGPSVSLPQPEVETESPLGSASSAGDTAQAPDNEPLFPPIGPKDVVVAFNFQGHFPVPSGAGYWEELVSEESRLIFLDHSDLNGELRDPNMNQAAWKEATHSMAMKLERLPYLEPPHVHVFFGGAQPLALWLGQRLFQLVRHATVIVYQLHATSRQWEPFFCTTSLSGTSPRARPLRRMEPLGAEVEGNQGTILALDIGRHAKPAQLEQLARERAVARIRRVATPIENQNLKPGDEVAGAVKATLTAFSELRSGAPSEPIYLTTSAPVGLLVALGTALSGTVYSAVWCCMYNSDDGRYYPALEVTRGALAAASRPRLEIFQKGIGVLFKLDGKLLEAVGDPLGGEDGINRVGRDKAALVSQAVSFSQRCLPEEVADAILNRSPLDSSPLDIEIQLGSEAAQLSWEMMRCPAETRFLVDYPDVTFTRVRPPSRTSYRPRALCSAGKKLKILIAPTLAKVDGKGRDSELYLELRQLCDSLVSLGAEVGSLPYGSTLADLDATVTSFKPDVLHWVCHGLPDQVKGLTNILQPSGLGGPEEVDRTEVPRFIRPDERSRPGGHRLKLLVLAACSAGDIRIEYGLPDVLLDDGIEAMVGFRDELLMTDAKVFADAFYTPLLEGESLRQAMRQSRSALLKWGGLPGSFASPLLCVRDPRAAGPLVERRER